MKKLALILLAAASLVGRPAPPRRSGMAAALTMVAVRTIVIDIRKQY